MKKSLLLLTVFIYTCTSKGLSQSTITDVDGNVYRTVQIGTQLWMKENLKTAHYRDGSAIVNGADSLTWANVFTNHTRMGMWCDYNDSIQYDSVYGKLYNWYAVIDPRGICPNGWHMPDTAEWWKAIDFWGGYMAAGDSMKALVLWPAPNANTDISGFDALPGGLRTEWSQFGYVITSAHFWSTTPRLTDSTNAMSFNLTSISPGFVRDNDLDEVGSGFSCRCVKDSLATGLSGPVGDNSDRVVIYPNPSAGNFYIRVGSVHTGWRTVEVFDVPGRSIERLGVMLQAGESQINLNISDRGVYIVRVTDGSSSILEKLVVK